MRKINLDELTTKIDPVVKARKDCFLVTAKNDSGVNCLTAGWFALGNVWEKKTATVFIRPQRYTKHFIDDSGRFTLSFFENYKDALMYLGTHSGEDEPNKIENSGLHLKDINGDLTYEEAKYTIVCRVIYKQNITADCFIDSDFAKKTYPQEDYSIQYVAEIEAVYEY